MNIRKHSIPLIALAGQVWGLAGKNAMTGAKMTVAT